MTLLYFILALLALSFLIFIHELGHYFMARRVGMRVEVFSIGFGQPIYFWMRKGVKWQIGWLPFGGYVKIAGSDTSSDKDLYKISDGFFGKSPMDRILVAIMGPLVNLVFAFLVFILLWLGGGREKNFSEMTSMIGWVDQQSALYEKGIRPGDRIVSYDNYRIQSSKDHLTFPIASDEEMLVEGLKIDYQKGDLTPFKYNVKIYSHPNLFAAEKGLVTSGITQSAQYLYYQEQPKNGDQSLFVTTPLLDSGILNGDRIIWVDGELIFSIRQLSEILNDERILLTIDRDGEHFLSRVPRVPARELRPDSEFREELEDWQYEASLEETKFNDLYVIPYNLTFNAVVENPLTFIDPESELEAFPKYPYSEREAILKSGDRIIAVQGIPIRYSYQLLKEIQDWRVNIIVQRGQSANKLKSFVDADQDFQQEVDWNGLETFSSLIGTKDQKQNYNSFYLLKSVTPLPTKDLLDTEKKARFSAEVEEKRKEVEAILDPVVRRQKLKALEEQTNKLVLGFTPKDRKVIYNPNPFVLFSNIYSEIWRVLTSLVSGNLSPKWISGPIGILDVVQSQWMISYKEVFYWIGFISLNLGILNLLPIPVLDGGMILLSFFELVTGRRIKPKLLEKISLIFALMFLLFFVFLTYNDISRLFGRFF